MAKKKAAKKIKTPRDRALPGMEGRAIPAIENAAEAYEAARDERLEVQQEEIRTQAKLSDVLKKHGFRGEKVYTRRLPDGTILKVSVVIPFRAALKGCAIDGLQKLSG